MREKFDIKEKRDLPFGQTSIGGAMPDRIELDGQYLR